MTLTQEIINTKKFHIVPNPVNAPGVCAFTGRHEDEWFIDTGLFLDWYGTVYMCKAFFVEMLEVILAGKLIPSPVGEGEAPKVAPILPETLAKIEELLSGTSTAITSLVQYALATGQLGSGAPELQGSPNVIVARVEHSREGVDNATRKTTGRKDRPVEPSDDTQLDRVPSPSGDNPVLDL